MNPFTGDIIVESGQYTGEYVFVSTTHAVCPKDCFQFTIYDSYGNGLTDDIYGNPGYYQVYFDNNLVQEGIEFESEESTLYGNGCPSSTPTLSTKPLITPSSDPVTSSTLSSTPSSNSTSPTSLPSSPSPSSSISPSLIFEPLSVSSITTSPSTPSSEPSSSRSSNPSTAPSKEASMAPSLLVEPLSALSSAPSIICDDNETPITVKVDLQTDGFPTDTSWNVMNPFTGDIIVESGQYTGEYVFVSTTHTVCPKDCFQFTIYDSYGDGLTDDIYGNPGYYQVYFDNNLVQEGIEFESEESTFYGNGCPSSTPTLSTKPLITPSSDPVTSSTLSSTPSSNSTA